MAHTKIEWADYTWNPVWGCKADCKYCYAKNIAKRFAKPMSEKNTEYGTEMEAMQIENDLKAFLPTFMHDNYREFKFPKTPGKRIFIGSMSDIAFWEYDWIKKVACKIKMHLDQTFILLTKFPEVYRKLDKIMPDNVWFGITVTNNKELSKVDELTFNTKHSRKRFISLEPLLEEIDTLKLFEVILYDWIIIGTMSGRNRTPANNQWIKNIIEVANAIGIPVFIKQIELNGKVEKDFSKFPKELQLRQFPLNY